MSLRVTALNSFDTSVSNLQRRQQELQTAQDRLTSGKRVAIASDDPVAAARAERALARMVRGEANQRALEASRNSMLQAESALGDAGDLLQQARELMLSAGNGSFDDTNRQTLANSLRGLRDQLLGIANRDDGNGGYLFGGQGTAKPPFLDDTGGVLYQGPGGQTQVTSEEALPLTLDGRRAWLEAPNPVAGGPGLSAWGVLDQFIEQISTDGIDGAAVKATVHTGVSQLDAVSNNLLNFRSIAGETLNRTDRVEDRIAASQVASQTERSNAEDLDMVKAISEFQNQQAGYDAALKSYSLVQKLSLFQYISA